jgi:hypothetical protein
VSAHIFTASWRTLADASMAGPLPVQPVRISRGTPRFWPEADAFPAVDELMPDGWMFGIKDLEKFGRCYRRKLHTIGLPRLRALLDAIDADGRPLALACFETDSADCHRGPLGFAGWWERKTGEQVLDLSVLRGRGGAVALVYEVEIEPATRCPKLHSGVMATNRPDGPTQLQLAGEGL